MTAAPLFDSDSEGRPDFDTVYTRCPACGVVAASSSASYRLTGDGGLDPTFPIELTCWQAGHRYTVTSAAFLPRDAQRVCARPSCGATFACPAQADEVTCPACRLLQPGPFLTPARSDHVRQVRADYADTVRALLHPPGGRP